MPGAVGRSGLDSSAQPWKGSGGDSGMLALKAKGQGVRRERSTPAVATSLLQVLANFLSTLNEGIWLLGTSEIQQNKNGYYLVNILVVLVTLLLACQNAGGTLNKDYSTCTNGYRGNLNIIPQILAL